MERVTRLQSHFQHDALSLFQVTAIYFDAPVASGSMDTTVTDSHASPVTCRHDAAAFGLRGTVSDVYRMAPAVEAR